MANIDVEYVHPVRQTTIPGTAANFRVYSVKFVCGEDSANLNDPVVSGIYRTAINVHNASFQPTFLYKKVVISNREGEPRGRFTGLISEQLGPNEAFDIDCVDIRKILSQFGIAAGPLITGFVEIITSPISQLNVVAVYTSN